MTRCRQQPLGAGVGRRRLLLALPSLLLLLPALLLAPLPGARAVFSWPGSKKAASEKEDPAEAFATVTGGRATLAKGVCLRHVTAGAHSTYAYPANDPIEDRHVVVDEQRPVDEEVGAVRQQEAPGMLHAAVFDGHGASASVCVCVNACEGPASVSARRDDRVTALIRSD